MKSLEPLVFLALVYFVVVPVFQALWRLFKNRKRAKPPAIPDYANESTVEESTRPDGPALSWWRETHDRFITVPTSEGRVRYYAVEKIAGALRKAILSGLHTSTSILQLHTRVSENEWNVSNQALGEFAQGYFKLNVLYRPVWACAMAGLKWGIFAGVGLKLVDTTVALMLVEPMAAVLLMVAVAVSFTPRVGVIGVIVVSLVMMKFYSVNFFLMGLVAALTGAALGALPGMALGGVLGLKIRHKQVFMPDVQREGKDILRRAILFPAGGALLIFGVYGGLILPWIESVAAERENPLLIEAIKKCDEQAAYDALRAGAKPDGDMLASEAACALHPGFSSLYAGGVGHDEVMKLMLKKGASVEGAACTDNAFGISREKDCGSPLHLEVLAGNDEVVELLLAKGAEKFEKEREGDKALIAAAGKGRERIVELLVDHGADVNVNAIGAEELEKQTESFRAMVAEAGNDQERILALGKKLGAELRPVGNTTPLMVAAAGGVHIVTFLLEHGAVVDAIARWDSLGDGVIRGDTALFFAVRKGQIEVAKLLVEKGADVNKRNSRSETALMKAVEANKLEVVRFLLEKNADPNVGRDRKTELGGPAEQHGETALMIAAEKGDMEIVRELLDRGADVNAKTRGGYTALWNAVGAGKPEVVKLLVERGANVNARTSDGSTVLCALDRYEWGHYSKTQESKEITKFFNSHNGKRSNCN
jgi:ankyrin repeat protein